MEEKTNPERKSRNTKSWHLKVLCKNNMGKGRTVIFSVFLRGSSEKGQEENNVGHLSQQPLTQRGHLHMAASFLNSVITTPSADHTPPRPDELYISSPFTNTLTWCPLPLWVAAGGGLRLVPFFQAQA